LVSNMHRWYLRNHVYNIWYLWVSFRYNQV